MSMTFGQGDLPLDPLLEAEFKSLRRLARGLMGDASAADDCVQDAWVIALRRPPSTNPVGWFRVVVRRLAYRRGREEGRRRRREAVAGRAGSAPTPEEMTAGIDLQRRILDAVESLEEPYRTTVILRYFHDLGPSRIALLQAVPEKTVKTRLHRAHRQLRAKLDRGEGGRRAWCATLAGLLPRPARVPLASFAAVGAIVAMKKVVAAVILLLVAGGVVWWAVAPFPAETEHAAVTGAPVPEEGSAGTLRGAGDPFAHPAVPAPEPPRRELAPTGDSVFAGRVVDEGGRPVGGARVRLVWLEPGLSKDDARYLPLLLRRERERNAAPSATTDAEGRFRIERPDPSTSYLYVEADGFGPAVERHPSGTPLTITLRREAWLRVRVLTDSGEPVASAEARLVTPWKSEGVPNLPRSVIASAATDARGLASLPRLRKGWLILEVAPKEPGLGVVERTIKTEEENDIEVRLPRVPTNRRQVVDAETGLPMPEAYTDVLWAFKSFSTYEHEGFRRRIHADAQGVIEVPIQERYPAMRVTAPGYEFAPAWDDPIRLVRAMRLEGAVTAPDGSPVAGAAVLLILPPSRVFYSAYAGLSPIDAWTDEVGRFSVEVRDVFPTIGESMPDRGLRALIALHPAYATAVVDGISVQPGRRVEVGLRFPKPASIALSVVDAQGRPVAGAQVRVAKLFAYPPGWPLSPYPDPGVDTGQLVRSRASSTAADGTLLLDLLPPGLHRVTAESTVMEVDLKEGERRELRLVRGLGPYIAGRVVGPNGAPVPSASVSLGGRTTGNRLTDAEGQFRFEDLPLGDYVVYTGSGAEGISREAKPGDDVTLRLPAGPARLRLFIDGPPAGKATFRLHTETGGYIEESPVPAEGETTKPFAPGVGTLIVQAEGFAWTAVRFQADEARVTDVRVSLLPGGSVSGRVLGTVDSKLDYIILRPDPLPEGVAASGHSQRHGQLSAPEAFGPLRQDGTFRIPDVRPGSYDVEHYRRAATGRDRTLLSSGRVVVKSAEQVSVELPR